ncbi:MAG: tripartite tricarboxylate transporter substrate binding protein, partial [Betaproteobacteria bacterium]|nr:tripartite tricarboxylate transporter substrate binding protein [Betaproteobacteria bacterium]
VMRAEEKSLGAQGFDAESASAEEFRQLMVRDSARWAELIKAQGIKAE